MTATNWITTIYKIYKEAWLNHPNSPGAKLHEAARDYLLPNGMPLLKIKGVWLLDEAQSYVELGTISQDTYKELETLLIQY